MKLVLLLGLLSGLLFGKSSGGAADESAVRDMVKRYSEARDLQDPKTIGALFTDNADQLVSTGEWRKGRPELVKGMLANSARETGKRTLTVETVRLLSPDVAIADARYEIGDRKMWSTFVMKRAGGNWRIEAIRNMLPSGNPPAR